MLIQYGSASSRACPEQLKDICVVQHTVRALRFPDSMESRSEAQASAGRDSAGPNKARLESCSGTQALAGRDSVGSSKARLESWSGTEALAGKDSVWPNNGWFESCSGTQAAVSQGRGFS